MFSSRGAWNPDGKHCYVTGGTSGLGLALALLLASKGAHVSVVARAQSALDSALAQLEAARVYPHQRLKAYSYDLRMFSESEKALQAVCAEFGGQAPDAVFTCAGAARPKYFVMLSEEDMRKGMDDAYWIQAWTILAAVKLMVRQRRPGLVTIVSSMVGYMSFLGWGPYAPGKHALHGLADTLQSELMLYDPPITAHLFVPATMLTPGFDKENVDKPQITRDIDDPASAITPANAACALLAGVQRGDAHITCDIVGDMFRVSSRGLAPRRGWVRDALLDWLAFWVAPIWRYFALDRRVRAKKTREEHRAFLEESGFFDSAVDRRN
ncbi:3-ketodihydrosphingosine reductase TSC10 [Mycena chlorophos]|uniref:3-ketodihydrosphingosine reductase TSC10 n=1 Tax=Mycena chlorophos TaxID=658473 RepID=A0A8H6TKT2_MYCCL|nr:3-ketodihydrosphingosine reductase TSC10 [Mycena chlorophos]